MRTKFDQKEIILETTQWIIILSKDQAYLGRCLVVLKRKCGDLAELTPEELSDFLEVVRKLENAFRKSFDATMFNWTCLMNNAYQESPPNPQVHWHFRPRYNHKVEFAGEVFEDTEFGNHYARGTNRKLTEKIRRSIVEKVRASL
jgi:diadenosine tetraphosphate (Ap4A) HIT family hydrolase